MEAHSSESSDRYVNLHAHLAVQVQIDQHRLLEHAAEEGLHARHAAVALDRMEGGKMRMEGGKMVVEEYAAFLTVRLYGAMRTLRACAFFCGR